MAKVYSISRRPSQPSSRASHPVLQVRWRLTRPDRVRVLGSATASADAASPGAVTQMERIPLCELLGEHLEFTHADLHRLLQWVQPDRSRLAGASPVDPPIGTSRHCELVVRLGPARRLVPVSAVGGILLPCSRVVRGALALARHGRSIAHVPLDLLDV